LPTASPPLQLAASRDFVMALGTFYVNWAKIELLMDLAICKFLDVAPTQAHAVTAAIDFGRRAFWLRSLINESATHKNKGNLIKALSGIQNDSKRNIFAHSYLSSTENTVTFIERSPHGKFTVRRHRYTQRGFSDHVNAIADSASAFQTALGISDDELNAFARAAINLTNKSHTSPTPPISSTE
jgi:hypothetical protein